MKQYSYFYDQVLPHLLRPAHFRRSSIKPLVQGDVGNALHMSYLFPLAVLINAVSMTILLIGLSFSGQSALGADVGIVQGLTIALFYAFSANARSLVLNPAARVSVGNLLVGRLVLLIPLSMVALYLSIYVAHVAWSLAFVLILRRGVEWLGELHLSEMELRGDQKLAGQYLALQVLLLLLLMGWMITGGPLPIVGLFLWAFLPLLMSMGFIRCHLTANSPLKATWLQMLPHLGSSAVIGIAVYVFRLLILSIVGKTVAGDLYAAFAIGGALGSIFTVALGPSLVLHEQKGGRRHKSVLLRAMLILVTLTGLGVIAIVYLMPNALSWVGKEMFFWQALGFSLIGGAVMVIAQRPRLRDLQHGTEADVFASDVLVNILIVAVIPFIYFFFGLNGLSCLYLFNALVALAFYRMADLRHTAMNIVGRHERRLKVLLALLLVIPIFVNLETGLFQSAVYIYDPVGILSKLPIPLSAFACYAGILLLGNYRQANIGLTMIFGSFVLMVLSVAMTYGNPNEAQAKFTLLIQYILPMFGIVLGLMYEDGSNTEHLVEKVMLIIIAALIPVQLVATWAQAKMLLTPYLYLFSIYQHLQYVPVIIVCSYVLVVFSLWDSPRWRMPILALAPLVGIYAAASASMLAGGFALIGCAAFAVHRMAHEKYRGHRIPEWVVGSLVLGAGIAYNFLAGWITKSTGGAWAGMYTLKFDGSSVINVQSRFDAWLYYLHGIFSDLSTFLLGHKLPPDRNIWPSAHNYYLDFVYNFGFIAVLVIIGLLVFTLIQLYRGRKHILISSATLGLTIVVLFLLIPDNLLKVGMRQPYSGIITFFLWGLLLARINSFLTADNGPQGRAPSAPG